MYIYISAETSAIYISAEVRKQVLRRIAVCRVDLFNRKRALQEKTQVTFNLAHYPVFKDVRRLLTELYL